MGLLGKIYNDGEIIVRQGETGNCMFVIQSGKVEVLREENNNEVRLAILEDNDFFGEMALVEREKRSATVRSMGKSQILTIDQKVFLRQVNEDPSFAFRVLKKMSQRIRELSAEITNMKAEYNKKAAK
jgi:CRP-like cAMP-binding protein